MDHASERQNGVRMSWNVIPSDRASAQRLSVPIGCIYTPFKPVESLPTIQYKPALCTRANCGAFLNPFAHIMSNTTWVCPFCTQQNTFTDQHPGMRQGTQPAEMMPNFSTAEYTLDSVVAAPIFIFVIDLAIIPEELTALKAGIMQAMMLLPEDALVSVITFGTDVHVYELGFKSFPKSYCIPGTTTITSQSISEILGLRLTAASAVAPRTEQKGPDMMGPGPHKINDGRSRFLQPYSECESQLMMIMEDLESDPWRPQPSDRPARCTGTAIATALCLLDATYKSCNARVLGFIGGAATVGMGAVAPVSLATPIRSHKEILRDEAPMLEEATQFYSRLSAMAGINGHVVDLFIGCLDQVGLYEMQTLVTHTGGNVVLDDSFTRGVFQGSLRQLFAQDPDDNDALAMAFSGELMIMTSKEIKVQGAVGHVVSMQKKAPCVADTVVGVGNTCSWRLGGLSHTSSVALFFDVAGAPITSGPQKALIQIATKYRHATGRRHVRVSTWAVPIRDYQNPEHKKIIHDSFDQEAAAVLVTRYNISRSVVDSPAEMCRIMDRMLIRFCAAVANYTKGDASTFQLGPRHVFFPQFMFHLRRSQFTQQHNNSPDEAMFFNCIGNREDTANTLPMIQPTLTSYSFSRGVNPGNLDSSAMQPDTILLLDTFFHVVVWFGSTVVQWRANMANYDESQRASMQQFLAAPMSDAREIMSSRLPTPRFIECVEGGSQARFLVAKLDHSKQQAQSMATDGDKKTVFSDDVSLKVFLKHLAGVAVRGI